MPKRRQPKRPLEVDTFVHDETRRTYIPSAEHASLLEDGDRSPIEVAYARRNRDLDPQLVWRGKDEQDLSDLVVQAPPLYIQERVHPKALVDDLMRMSGREDVHEPTLFDDFNGLPEDADRTDFYEHDANWTNRMILGDSLQVMASLAEREGLRGKVQCIYLDPPYGIKFNSNFQWSTTSRDVHDGRREHITREPEQVRAFRDTWRDGIHSYLSYLRDRLVVARDLLSDSGSIFVQISDENVHRVRALMDEVFGEDNAVREIVYRTTTGKASATLDSTRDFVLWYAKSVGDIKFRRLMYERDASADWNYRFDFLEDGRLIRASERTNRLASINPMTSQSGSTTTKFEYEAFGERFVPGKGGWKTNLSGMTRLRRASRLAYSGKTLRFVRPFRDFAFQSFTDVWDDTRQSGFGDPKIYVVQTFSRVIERCILMTTDPGDLVLDPTCGSGTTAFVAEQWGRRWITIDTSRVALALARARVMGARYPWYLLADSVEGQQKEAEVTHTTPSEAPTYGDIRQGFVYERVPHITLRAIANNAEIDVIWERFQKELEPLRELLNDELGLTGDDAWEEWEIPREADDAWPDFAKECHRDWWKQRIARQREIDASIAAKADFEYLYDKPYEDKRKVRVAGPFTVESLSPHRVLGVDEDDELLDPLAQPRLDPLAQPRQVAEAAGHYEPQDFAGMVLQNLRTAGVQQAHKDDRIDFDALSPWPGELVCAEGRYEESGVVRRAGIFVGPEFGTVSRPDLIEAAQETAEAGMDVLVACAFNFEAHTTDFQRLGRIPVLKARMNPDLHMPELKNTGAGNLFVIFGEPDIDIEPVDDSHFQVRVNGVDVFDPSKGEVRSDGPDGIACWFVDTDYNGEAFFVRHAYFLGASDPYKSLRTTLKAEIDADAWESLHSDTSRPFEAPESGRIAVKAINHLGDEVMKVFRV